MPEQPDDQSDSEAIDRAFAELIAGLEFSSTDPDETPGSPASPDPVDPDSADDSATDPGWREQSPHSSSDYPELPNGINAPEGVDETPPGTGQDATGASSDDDRLLADLERQFRTWYSWPDSPAGGDHGSPAARGDRSGVERRDVIRPRHADFPPPDQNRSGTSRSGEQSQPAVWRGRDPDVPVPELDPDGWDDLTDDPDEGKPHPPPWPRLPAPVLIGWLGILIPIVTIVVAALGVDLPRWAAWLAIVAFAGSFGLLLSRLPRHRPPDSSDGAQL